MMINDQRVKLGRITAVYGIKGWVKIYSNTEPMQNIFTYAPWQVCINGQWQTVKVKQGKRHGKGLIALLDHCENREQAKVYSGADIAVEQQQLPPLDEGDYYWSQLFGKSVETNTGLTLGKVDHMLATGANDVMVVKASEGSVDDRQRLIPWLPEQVVKQVDLTRGVIQVDWDVDF